MIDSTGPFQAEIGIENSDRDVGTESVEPVVDTSEGVEVDDLDGKVDTEASNVVLDTPVVEIDVDRTLFEELPVAMPDTDP